MLLAVVRLQGAGEGRQPRTRRDYLVAALPGVFLAADLAAWHTSLHLTSVANSTLIVNLTPIFVTLATWVLLSQPPSRAFVAGLVLAVIGVVMLKGGLGSIAEGDVRGDLVALSAAAFYAGYLMLLARARQTFSAGVIMLWSTVSATVVTLPLAIVMETALLPSTATAWAVVLALGWVSHAGGQGLVTYALAWLPPAFSSLTLLIQPVVAAALAWLMFSESLTPLQMAGGLVVLAGVAVARR